MNKHFHNQDFGETTTLKLAIFKGYIREWVSLWMTHFQSQVTSVNIFDFFAGPGRDTCGNPGSPSIIADELKSYCASHENWKATNRCVRMFFNNADSAKIESQKGHLFTNACGRGSCQFKYLA